MITRQLTVNVYEVGEVLDFSEVMPKHHKSALENAKKALVISTRRLMSGAYSYIVVTDKANTVQVSEEEIQAATMIDKVDLSALFDGEEEETEADDDGPRCEETPQSVKEKNANTTETTTKETVSESGKTSAAIGKERRKMPTLDRNGYAPSLLPSTGCYLCKHSGDLVRHEVFFGRTGNRPKSKKYGLWVTLCPTCHTIGPKAVHNNAAVNLKLKQEAQTVAMEHYGWTVDEFREQFGKSWI